MREPKTKVIDGVTFEVTPLGFKRGRQAFVRLGKAVGPALGAVDSVEALQAGDGVSKALERLLLDVSDDDLEWFAETFGETTRFWRDVSKGQPYLKSDNREALFAGQLMLFFKWLMFACEVNFSDFLGFVRPAKSGDGLSEKTGPLPKES